MTETARQLKEIPKPLYEEEFIKRKVFGCFVTYTFIVVKKKTVLVYPSEEAYKLNPEKPESFFNISFLTCTLNEDSVKLSNDYSEITLRHHEPTKLLEMLEAINHGRRAFGPTDLFPKLFVDNRSSTSSG